ncbi:MAG: metallophosphoesterase [Opitutales bacterium]
MVKPSHSEPKRGVTFGDLHLLAGRHAFMAGREWQTRWREDYDLCVLNGDIFDFRWARQMHPEEALAAARSWLEDLLQPVGRARFIVIMGNHDALPAYHALLDELMAENAHLRWAEHWVRVGDKVFFHGDFPDETGTVESLRHARIQHGHGPRPGRGKRALYWLATRSGVTGSVPRALPWRRYCERSARFLGRELGSDFDEVRDVFLGHTHVYFRDLELGGRRFHNSGAPLPGATFKPIEFAFTDREWARLATG